MRSGRIPTLVDICTQGSSPRRLKNSSSSLPEPAQPIRCGRCQVGRWQSVFLKGTFVCKHGSAEACLFHRRISHNFCRLCVRLSTHNQVSAQQQDSLTEFSDNFSRRVLRYKTTVQCVHFLLFLGCFLSCRGWRGPAKILTNQGSVATAPKHLTGETWLHQRLAQSAWPTKRIIGK